MSDINEAYARIDYKFLSDLSSRITKVEDRLDNIRRRVSNINGKFKDIKNFTFYANRQSFSSREKMIFKFGNLFDEAPVVSLTIDPVDDNTTPNIYITDINKDHVKFRIEGGGSRTRVHCLAIGESVSDPRDE